MVTLEDAREFIKNYDGPQIKIMEVCGTHTASIFKNGIRSLLSPKIKLISGPGCPVCVTAEEYIDRLVEISKTSGSCVLTFGDMMKVKGSRMSLTEAKAEGGNVRVVYSPLDAIGLASENKHTNYVFAAVGFETTAPIYGILLDQAVKKNITNLKILTSLKTVIPALEFICQTEKGIDAFLSPGHVSVIIGSAVYEDLARKYKKPFVVGGFEGQHIIAAVYEIVNQIKNGKYEVKNLYKNAVAEDGNQSALEVINKYFEPSDAFWRGIGIIKGSGLLLKPEYGAFDAGSKFESYNEKMPAGCRCSDVILGRINPDECPLFKKTCTPFSAVGPCMVSSEGACGIWYKNKGVSLS